MKFLGFLSILLLIAACAKRPAQIEPEFVSRAECSGYSSDEAYRELTYLSEEQNRIATKDMWDTAIWGAPLRKTPFAQQYDDHAPRISELKGLIAACE